MYIQIFLQSAPFHPPSLLSHPTPMQWILPPTSATLFPASSVHYRHSCLHAVVHLTFPVWRTFSSFSILSFLQSQVLKSLPFQEVFLDVPVWGSSVSPPKTAIVIFSIILQAFGINDLSQHISQLHLLSTCYMLGTALDTSFRIINLNQAPALLTSCVTWACFVTSPSISSSIWNTRM